MDWPTSIERVRHNDNETAAHSAPVPSIHEARDGASCAERASASHTSRRCADTPGRALLAGEPRQSEDHRGASALSCRPGARAGSDASTGPADPAWLHELL